MLIDLPRLRDVTMARDPFPWAVSQPLLDERWLAELSLSFPTEGFHLSERLDGPEKHYRTYDRSLTDVTGADRQALADLPGPWQAFAADLLSDDYRAAIADVTGRDLSRCRPVVRLCRYGPSCWIDPHTDRVDKPVTHVWYFNQIWRPEWGGSLRIMGGSAAGPDDVTIPPAPGATSLIRVSDRSWHAVDPVASGAPGDRCSVLVHFVVADA